MEFKVLTNTIKIRPYKLKELFHIYGVSRRTFLKWIKPFEKEIGKRDGHYYKVPQVKIIFEKLSLPADAVENDQF